MRLRMLALLLTFLCCAPGVFGAQIDELTTANLPRFIVDFNQSLNQTSLAFKRLADAKLPLFDESGHPLGRRRVSNRRLVLVDLRKTLADFRKNPRGLVLTMTLSEQAEELADEVYDLSQICYDNDREELGQELSALLTTLNQYADLLDSYALRLATEKEQQLRASERENQELQKKVKKAASH